MAWVPTSFQILHDAQRGVPTARDKNREAARLGMFLDDAKNKGDDGDDYWFRGIEQQQAISSASTNTIDVSAETWSGPPVYGPPEGAALPFPDIVDNTEGIGAAAHVLSIGGFTGRGGGGGEGGEGGEGGGGDDDDRVLVLDLGGGQFDGVPNWLAAQSGGKIVTLVADPFNRSKEHNRAGQVRLCRLNHFLSICSSFASCSLSARR